MLLFSLLRLKKQQQQTQPKMVLQCTERTLAYIAQQPTELITRVGANFSLLWSQPWGSRLQHFTMHIRSECLSTLRICYAGCRHWSGVKGFRKFKHTTSGGSSLATRVTFKGIPKGWWRATDKTFESYKLVAASFQELVSCYLLWTDQPIFVHYTCTKILRKKMPIT